MNDESILFSIVFLFSLFSFSVCVEHFDRKKNKKRNKTQYFIHLGFNSILELA